MVFGAGASAQTECFITGTITAEMVDHELGMYRYTLELMWDTGSQYALSHANLLLDPGFGDCLCVDFEEALAWEDPIGFSDGYPEGCTVYYYGMIECDGDPSIYGVDGFLLKFEPFEEEDCEPGTTGTGIFVFYSDFGPAPIDEDFLSLVDKNGQNSCTGTLTGDFPAIPCDPVSNEARTWTNVKGLYIR
jgi:hypothetical protein